MPRYEAQPTRKESSQLSFITLVRSLPPKKKHRHLDLRCSQSHREQRSGEPPHFAFVFAFVFLVVIPEGDLLLPLRSFAVDPYSNRR
jgi:hypothetical protein